MKKLVFIYLILSFSIYFDLKPLINFLISCEDWKGLDNIIDGGYEGIDDIQDSIFKRTALHCSVLDKNIEAISYLLSKSADPNIPDFYGNTALHLAVKHSYIDIIELLLAYQKCNLNITDNKGFTVFDICKSKDIKKMLKNYRKKIFKKQVKSAIFKKELKEKKIYKIKRFKSFIN